MTMPQEFQIVMENVIFQGGILTTQLGMEAARSGRDVFKNNATKAEDALALLSDKRNGELKQDMDALSDYISTLTAFTKGLHADAEVIMPHGLTFAYIARELDVFIEKMAAALEHTKQ